MVPGGYCAGDLAPLYLQSYQPGLLLAADMFLPILGTAPAAGTSHPALALVQVWNHQGMVQLWLYPCIWVQEQTQMHELMLSPEAFLRLAHLLDLI